MIDIHEYLTNNDWEFKGMRTEDSAVIYQKNDLKVETDTLGIFLYIRDTDNNWKRIAGLVYDQLQIKKLSRNPVIRNILVDGKKGNPRIWFDIKNGNIGIESMGARR